MAFYSWSDVARKLEGLRHQLGKDIKSGDVRPEVAPLVKEAYDLCETSIPKIKEALGYVKSGKGETATKLLTTVTANIRRLEEIMQSM